MTVIDFTISYMTHWEGHVEPCKHFDMSACTCRPEDLTKELANLRAELSSQEAELEKNQVSGTQARKEVARLRSMVEWQRRSIIETVVKPVIED